MLLPDRVLMSSTPSSISSESDLGDSGDNFLRAFVGINTNLDTRHHLRDMAATLRLLKPSLKSLDCNNLVAIRSW